MEVIVQHVVQLVEIVLNVVLTILYAQDVADAQLVDALVHMIVDVQVVMLK